MEHIIDYSLQDLENLVAAAPYSQYHQMLLAIKRNELLKSTLYQPYLGSLPELKNEIQKAADKVVPIRNISPAIEPEKDPLPIAETEQIAESLTESTLPEPTKPPSENKEKIKSKKLKHKIKKKNKKKKNKKKSEDLSELSAFSQWLLTGRGDGDAGKNKKKKNKKKHSKKSIFDAGLDAKPEVISEPLAELLARQGHKEKSIEMFEKLKKLFPEKETIYSARIKEINNGE